MLFVPQRSRLNACDHGLFTSFQKSHTQRILASTGRTEAERGFCGHLGPELVTTSRPENTAVRYTEIGRAHV